MFKLNFTLGKTFLPFQRIGKNCRKGFNKGFTLIEFIIGISLGLIVLAGVIAVYIPTLQTWQASAGVAELQDTEVVLHERLGTFIRQAGIVGCGNDRPITDGVDPAINRAADAINVWALSGANFMSNTFMAFAADNAAGITATLSAGLQNLRITSVPADLVSPPIGDVFYALSPSDEANSYYRVTNSSAGINKQLSVTDSNGSTAVTVSQGDLYLVIDCDNPVLISASADSTTGVINYTNNKLITATHKRNIVVTKFDPSVFYIGQLNAVPTLYKRSIALNAAGNAFITVDAPIVTGIENMRIEYGVAMDGGGNATQHITNYYTLPSLPAIFTANLAVNPVATMNMVRSVRVSVMIQSAQSSSGLRQSALNFPALNGVIQNCYGPIAPDVSACPAYVTNAAGRLRAHKVVIFTFNLPRQTSI